MSNSTKPYTVGYGKTPVHSRFAPGKSGNPAGRPKGAKNLQTLALAELDKKVDVIVGGRPSRLSKGEVIVIKQVDRAMTGNDRAFAQLLKIDGSSLAGSTGAGEAPRSASEIPDEDYTSMLAELVQRRTLEGDDASAPD